MTKKVNRVGASQREAAQRARVPIPTGIGLAHLTEIRDHMTRILKQFEPLGAIQANLRLNQSDRKDPAPIFIDWVGNTQAFSILTENHIDPGLYRFGENHPTEIYQETLEAAPERIPHRDWKNRNHLSKKTQYAKMLAPKVGAWYQKFIGILATDPEGQDRCIGTLTVGFSQEPDRKTREKIEEKMKEWASWHPESKSPLSEYLEKTFKVGGRII